MKMQVIDNPELLEIMLNDFGTIPEIYQTTNYWAYNSDVFINELFERGLQDFRRRKNSRLSGFGATDLAPEWMFDFRNKAPLFSNRIINRLPFRLSLLTILNNIVSKIIHLFPKYINYIKTTPYLVAKAEGEKVGAKSIDTLECSLVGNPEDIIIINDRAYTTKMLDYYLRYVYATQFINFDNINMFVELGSGCGKQIEIIKKLHPDICFFVFEIPPQLYVCEQYLHSVFPESIVSYQQTKDMDNLLAEKGKIFLFGNWKFPIIENISFDLFWNAASFQEMEPNVVSNYLQIINSNAKNVYLFEKMDGKELASELTGGGVINRTTLSDYMRCLFDFSLVDISKPKFTRHQFLVNPLFKWLKSNRRKNRNVPHPVNKEAALSKKGYRDSFWIRQ